LLELGDAHAGRLEHYERKPVRHSGRLVTRVGASICAFPHFGVRVSRKKRTYGAAKGRRADWLGGVPPARGRVWALGEQLFGRASDKARGAVLDALTTDLAEEKAGLAHLEEELREQARKVAMLEWRLRVLKGIVPVAARLANTPRQRAALVAGRSRSSLEREYWLCRCEGFWVDSPAGRVGLVGGLRFLSRIDQPALLEVRGGVP